MHFRKLTVRLLAVTLASSAALCAAQDKTEITLARFFGACEADYGKAVDASKAQGECGIITTLVNEFNATNKQGIVVKPQIAEWQPFYDQLSARIVSKDVPTISVMHESVLGDYVARKLVEPLDDGFKSVGISTDQFSEQAKTGAIIGGKAYALPFDTWSWLWHINGNLMKKAGLTKADGTVILPQSPEELLAQARKFKEATGKPYLSWPAADVAGNFRSLVTLVAQQNASLFPTSGKQIDMHSKAVRNALELANTLYSEGLIKPNLDYSAGNQAFVNGDVGVHIVGTWTIGDFVAAAEKADSPLKGGYSVVPFAKLYAKKAAFADGHSWVMLKGGAKDEKTRKAALTFMKFLWDRDYEWARTGHLPANKTAAERDDFKKLPFRSNILEISSIGVSLPNSVPRQRAIESIVGEEMVNMMVAKKPIDAVQKSAEERVNKLLAGVR
ncbi:multiple sugar transport system substrate-binding protein [Rhodoferax sp. OV413]|uniref:extracellular solute-binding protein n=1 Tax=Rhodoferax sp. OV413 TaxID=1855285 RepID=UPI00088E9D2D|nr:extracellular solute-binding protein [Rhodoferax sp. OV413]SDP37871.1 multiple sugar transport system substrate-binding protein [Rhodoferax sp. OV413]